MDREEATGILTGELVKHKGRLIVSNELSQSKLIERAKYDYILGDSIIVSYYRYDGAKYSRECGKEAKKVTGKSIEEVLKGDIPAGANYLFFSQPTRWNSDRIVMTVTPYSIIGEKEVESIRRLFYKDYDIQIREAINTLGIEDYFDLYRLYFNNGPEFQTLFSFGFKEKLLKFLKSRQYDSTNDTRLSKFEEEFDLEELNSRFVELGIDFAFNLEATWISKNKVNRLIQLLLDKHDFKNPLKRNFLKFVFEIPYEDQNLEINKILFKEFNHLLDTTSILLKEYWQGKFFKEYFKLLDEKNQRGIVDSLKNSGLQNPIYNSFLWKKGFKDVDLDYLDLYKKDAGNFIKYFQGRTPEEKKVILNDIMGCDFTNSEVTKWLDENESRLIREVGLENG